MQARVQVLCDVVAAGVDAQPQRRERVTEREGRARAVIDDEVEALARRVRFERRQLQLVDLLDVRARAPRWRLLRVPVPESQPSTLPHGKYCALQLQHAHLEHVRLIAPPRREVALVEVREVVAVRRLVGPRAQRDGV